MFRGINLCGAENNAEPPEQHRAHLSRVSNQNFTQPMPFCQDRKSLFIDASIYFVWMLQKEGHALRVPLFGIWVKTRKNSVPSGRDALFYTALFVTGGLR